MKCEFCGVQFTPTTKDQSICTECIHAVDELTDGKGDDEDE